MKTPLAKYTVLGAALLLVMFFAWITWHDISPTLQDHISRSAVILIAKQKDGSKQDWIVDSILKGKDILQSKLSIGSILKRSPVEGRQPDALVVFIYKQPFSDKLQIRSEYAVYDGIVADGNLPLSELSKQFRK